MRSNKISVLKRLIEYGNNNKLDINCTDNFNRTALHYAVDYSARQHNMNNGTNVITSGGDEIAFQIEKLLVANGADLNKLDIDHRTPFHYAFVRVNKKYAKGTIDPIEIVSDFMALRSNKKGWFLLFFLMFVVFCQTVPFFFSECVFFFSVFGCVVVNIKHLCVYVSNNCVSNLTSNLTSNLILTMLKYMCLNGFFFLSKNEFFFL